MKVLYIVSTLQSTGPVNQLYGIIHNLDRDKYTPYILTLSNEPQNSRKKLFEDDNVEVKTLGLNRIAFIFRGKGNLKRVLAQISPDLIHTSGIRADTIMTTLNIDTPLCSTIRNYIFEDYISLYGMIWGRIMGIWHENAIKRMKNPICCSKTLKEKYAKQLKREFYTIQNGVDIQSYYVKNENDRLRIRKNLNLSLDKKVIIVVGGIIERKDPVTIINAVEQMQEKSSFQLVFIGDGGMTRKLQKKESAYIKFLGHKNNVSEYFQAADFFISASRSEGLPNTVLEAGACGMPMILSDIPQHKEIFEGIKMAGVDFFHTGDALHLAGKIAQFLKEYRNCSRKAISDYIKGKFDSRIMSSNYQDFYRKCLEEAGAEINQNYLKADDGTKMV